MHASDRKYAESLHNSALRLAIAAVLLTALQHLLGPARLAASFSGITDASLQSFFLQSDAGVAHSIRICGLLIIVAGVVMKSRAFAVTGAVIACLSFILMGHSTTYSPRWLLAPLLMLHVTIISFWFGSLRPLRRPVDEDHTVMAERLDHFSRIASRVVPAVVVAGLGLTLVLLESLADLTTPYGIMIIAKISGFTLLLALACLNRWRLLPGIRTGQTAAATSFRNIAAAEWLIIALLIITTVVVTSLFSP